MSRVASLVIATLVTASLPAMATTWYVPSAECPTIQAGIDATAAGDTVLVACGTYYEHHIIMKSGVYLTSETGQADCVTVDAQQLGRVFYCDGVDSLASVVGFTVKGGVAPSGPYPDGGGAGMYCSSSSPTLTNCTLSGNQADYFGGGVLCVSSSSPTLTNCTFVENSASRTGLGGGMACYYSSPKLAECTFWRNTASDGGGMSCRSDSSPTLTNCTFSENYALHGGGMYCHRDSSPTLTNCTFSGNQTNQTGTGGGVHCSSSSPALTNCTFSSNQADYYGGGMYCDYSSPMLTDCTFSGNHARGYGGGMYCRGGSSPTLTDCIIAFSPRGAAITGGALLVCCDIYGNDGGDWVGNIADQYGVEGNFSADPLFCDMYNDDFSLCANSPCLPDGNDCEVLIGAYGEGCPDCENPAEMNSWGSIKAMYR